MSMYRRFPTDGLPSFVTTNTYERARIFISREASQLLLHTMYDIRSEEPFQLLAFAIMPDHLHIIAVPSPSQRLGRAMQLIKGRFSRAYNCVDNRTGHVWQSRYHERTLRTEEELVRAVEYVHNNPVVAGLATVPEDYEWSSANGRFVTDFEDYSGQAKA